MCLHLVLTFFGCSWFPEVSPWMLGTLWTIQRNCVMLVGDGERRRLELGPCRHWFFSATCLSTHPGWPIELWWRRVFPGACCPWLPWFSFLALNTFPFLIQDWFWGFHPSPQIFCHIYSWENVERDGQRKGEGLSWRGQDEIWCKRLGMSVRKEEEKNTCEASSAGTWEM